MSTKHTPGAIRAATAIWEAQRGAYVETMFGRKTLEGLADLIDRETAAPDLLAALEDTLQAAYDCGCGHDPMTDAEREYIDVARRARAAIAKATAKAE